MNSVLKKYKDDIIVLGIIAILFLLFVSFFWGRFGDTMVDCPRELYLPSEILKGKILYKDLFSLYQPLGYLVNALFVAIFGSSFNLFYILGAVNTFVCLILIYCISRCFARQFLSLSIVVLTLFTCCLSLNMIVNYIFPYSYSFIYALTCFLASVLLFVLYFKKDFQDKYIFLSFIFAGLSIAFKFEFALSFLPFLFVFFRTGKIQFSNLFKALCFLMLPCVITLFIPVFQSNLYTLDIFADYLKKFFASESTIYFVNKLCYKSPVQFLTLNLKHLLFFLLYFIPACLLSYIFVKKENNVPKVFRIAAFLLLLFGSYPLIHYIWTAKLYIFSFFPVLVLIFSIFYFSKWTVEKNDKNFFLCLITMSVFLSSLRVYAFLASNHYGKFILPMFFVCVFAVCFKSLIPEEKEALYEKVISCSVLIFAFWMLLFAACDLFVAKNYRINSEKGSIWGSYPVAKTVEETANYLKNNSDSEDKVLVLPEGLLINYLSNRASSDLYYQLLPNHIDILGESKIVEGLKKDNIKYIVLTSLSTPSYGKSNFCLDYGLLICEYINSEYDVQTTVTNVEETRAFSTIILKKIQ